MSWYSGPYYAPTTPRKVVGGLKLRGKRAEEVEEIIRERRANLVRKGKLKAPPERKVDWNVVAENLGEEFGLLIDSSSGYWKRFEELMAHRDEISDISLKKLVRSALGVGRTLHTLCSKLIGRNEDRRRFLEMKGN